MLLAKLPSGPLSSRGRALKDDLEERLLHLSETTRFFHEHVLPEQPVGPSTTTVLSELKLAKSLLRVDEDLIRIVSTDTRVRIPAIRNPLCLVVLQLLSNSIREVDTGDAKEQFIIVSVKKIQKPAGVIIDVKDSGKGMSLDDLEHTKGNDAPRYQHGLGLGLRYAKMICRAYGWSLNLISANPNRRRQQEAPTFWRINIPIST